jgi:hypothetical protein
VFVVGAPTSGKSQLCFAIATGCSDADKFKPGVAGGGFQVRLSFESLAQKRSNICHLVLHSIRCLHLLQCCSRSWACATWVACACRLTSAAVPRLELRL